LFIALVAFFALYRLPELAGRLLELGLGRVFNRPVSVREVHFNWLPLQAEIADLRVGGLTPEAPPFLHIPRIVAVPRLGPLWGRRLDLAVLRLEGPQLRIRALPEGGDDIPSFGRGGGGGFELRLGRLEIRDGEFILDHSRIPLELDLPDLRGGLSRSAGHLRGRISFGPGTMRFGDAASFPFGTQLDLVVNGSTLDVHAGRLWTEKIELACEGQIQLARRPTGVFSLHGRVDLEDLDSHVMRTGFGIKGDGLWEGGFSFEGSQLRIEGELRGTNGEFDGVAVPSYASHVLWSDGATRFTRLHVDAMGGSAVLDLDFPPREAERRMRGELKGVDVDSLAALIFDIGRGGFAGKATGPFDVTWPWGRFRELSGTLTASVAAGEGGIPLTGLLEWRADAGVQLIDRLAFRTGSTSADIAGRIDLDRQTKLTLDVESSDLATTDAEIRRLRHALGVEDVAPTGLGGSGHFRGDWLGTTTEPIFDGHLEAPQLSYLGVDWGVADWKGRVTTEAVQTTALDVKRGRAALTLSGRAATGQWGASDGMDVEVRFRGWPAQDFATSLGWDLPLVGALDGEARVRGRRSAPVGFARVRAKKGHYLSIPFEQLETEALFGDSVTVISRGRARVMEGDLTFRGALSDTGGWDARVEAEGMQLTAWKPSPAGPPLSGALSGELTVLGTLERPLVVAALTSPEVHLGAASLGRVSVSLVGEGNGQVALAASTESDDLHSTARGRISATAPHTSSVELRLRAPRLAPYLRAMEWSIPSAVGVAVEGDLQVDGPLQDWRQWRASATVPSFQLQFEDYAIQNPEPLQIELAEGQLAIHSFRLAGEGTDLAVVGEIDLVADEARLDIDGLADLRFLPSIAPRVRGAGAARLAAVVRGSTAEPELRGTLDVEAAALRLRGIPHGIEALEGSVRFTESVAEFSELKGTLGGGPIQIEGQVSYGSGGLEAIDINARARGVALRYPKGLRSRLDAALRIFGDEHEQWVTGTIDVARAEWTRRYDITSELLEGATTWELEPSLSEGVRFDVRIRAPGTLKIDNNLTTLHASADLRLQGTAAAPVLLGRAEMDRGRVYFQGNTYIIRHGTIDFADTHRTRPLFDVEAETRVRSYRVALRLNGTLDHVVPTLTSDPPLSPVQILNLLAGGDESAVASLAQTRADQARLAATGAASLASARLTEEVGLEREAERLLGLNRFSIDPSVLKGDFTNPTARLTLGKRIGPDLNVQYSQDLSSDADPLFALEYNLSDRLSIVITQSESDGLGFDFRIRQTQ
jgi:autotransporter translocation and assembly factor TamB